MTRTGRLVVSAALLAGLAGCGEAATTATTGGSRAADVTTDSASSADGETASGSSSEAVGAEGTGDGGSETAADVSVDELSFDVHRDPG